MSTKKKSKKVVESKKLTHADLWDDIECAATSLADLMLQQDEEVEELRGLVYGLTRRVMSLEVIIAQQTASRTFTGTWHG
jgi:hypothetical protein